MIFLGHSRSLQIVLFDISIPVPIKLLLERCLYLVPFPSCYHLFIDYEHKTYVNFEEYFSGI